MNIRIVLRINAGVTLAIGLSLLIPLLLSLLYQDGSWESFLLPAVILLAVGGVGSWVTRLPRSSKAVGYVSNQDVYLSVTLTWTLAAVLGGVPFLLEGTFDNLLDSTFEAMSGSTTTGATLLSEIETQTPSILFWRSMTQWLGGIGIVVLFVAVAPCDRVWGGTSLRSRSLGAHPATLYTTHCRHRQSTAGHLHDTQPS